MTDDPPSTPSPSNRSSIPRKKKTVFNTSISDTSTTSTQLQTSRSREFSNPPGPSERRSIERSPSVRSIPSSPSVRWNHSRRHSRQQSSTTSPSSLKPETPSAIPVPIIPPKTPQITITVTPPSSSPETTPSTRTPSTPTYRSTGSSPTTTYRPSETSPPASSPPYRSPLRTSPRIPTTFRPPTRPRQASPTFIPSPHIPRPIIPSSRSNLQSEDPPQPNPRPSPSSPCRQQLKVTTNPVTPRPKPHLLFHKAPYMPHSISPSSPRSRPALQKHHTDLSPQPPTRIKSPPNTPRTGSAPPATPYRPKITLNTSQGLKSIHLGEGASPSRLPVPKRNLGSPRSEGARSPRSPRARDEFGRMLEREALESFRDLKSVGLERERRGRFGGNLRHDVEAERSEVVVLESSEDDGSEEEDEREPELIPPEEEEIPPEVQFLRQSAAASSAGVGLRHPLFEKFPRPGSSKEERNSNNKKSNKDGFPPFYNSTVFGTKKKHHKETPSFTATNLSFSPNNSFLVVQNLQNRINKSPTMKPDPSSLTIGIASPASSPFHPSLSPSLDPKGHGYDPEHPTVHKLRIDDSIPHIIIHHKREGICIHSTHPTHGIIGSLAPEQSSQPGVSSSDSSSATTDITTYNFRLAPLPGQQPLNPSELSLQTIHPPLGMRFRQGRVLCIYDHTGRGKAEEDMEVKLKGGEGEEKAWRLREGRGGARAYWKDRAARWVFLEVVGGREESVE